jgi:hypothetical protein
MTPPANRHAKLQQQATLPRRDGRNRSNAWLAPLCCVVFAAGCAGATEPIDVAAHPNVRPDRLVEFIYQDDRVQLDSVVFSRDSISGIPWHAAEHCCVRVAYPLARISHPEIRTFPPVGGIIGMALGIVLLVGYEVAIHVAE